MLYENQTVVFPMGMKFKTGKGELNHTLNGCKLKMRNRRDTLKIGNAIRIRQLKEDTTFESCTIYMEGTLVKNRIIPVAIHECFIYGTAEDGLPFKVGGTYAHASCKGAHRYV